MTLDSRGFTYLKMRKAAAAITDYDAALKADPKSATSLYGRGLAKLFNGEKVSAESDIAAARQIDPEIANKFEGWGAHAP
jgi:hypothetical protein